MKKESNRCFSIIAIVLLVITLLVGAAVYIMLPRVVSFYVRFADLAVRQHVIDTITPVLYIVGIPVLATLALALLMMINIAKGKAFVKTNVTYLKLISLCALVTGLIFIYPMFTMDSIYPIVLFVVFIILSICCLVFSELFRTAIRIKEENELTI